MITNLFFLSTLVFGSDNLVILLDTSGSMYENLQGVSRIHAAQQSLNVVVKTISPDTNVGLLTFHGWIYKLGPLNQNSFIAAVNGARVGGGTPLGAYMKEGADALLQCREKEHGLGSYKMLVVTDGEATDMNYMLKNYNDILSRGIVVDVIGVGMTTDHTLSKLANRYMNAADQDTLLNAVIKSVAEVPLTDKVADEYDLISELPEKVSTNIIKTLTTQYNQPIGEKPVITTTGIEEVPSHSMMPVLVVVAGLFLVLIVVIIFVLWANN
jgi:Ca-activated chloride channel family protein